MDAHRLAREVEALDNREAARGGADDLLDLSHRLLRPRGRLVELLELVDEREDLLVLDGGVLLLELVDEVGDHVDIAALRKCEVNASG